MINQEFKADLIEVIEKGGFKTNHTFQVTDEKLGVLELNGIKSAGVFKAENGQELVCKKTSPWKSTYELSENGTQTGFASSRKTLGQDYLIQYQGEIFGLIPGGSRLRSWRVMNPSKQEICEYLPRGGFKRGAYVKIRADIPLGLLVFCYVLVSNRWMEHS